PRSRSERTTPHRPATARPPAMTADPAPDGETVLTMAAGAFVGCCLAVWSAGQLAARIWTGAWLPASLWESPAILWRLAVDPAHPAAAWPANAATTFPHPVAYYTVLAVLIIGVLSVAAMGWRWHQ